MKYVTADLVEGRYILDMIFGSRADAKARCKARKSHPMHRPHVLAWPEDAPEPKDVDRKNHRYPAYWRSELDRIGVVIQRYRGKKWSA